MPTVPAPQPPTHTHESTAHSTCRGLSGCCLAGLYQIRQLWTRGTVSSAPPAPAMELAARLLSASSHLHFVSHVACPPGACQTGAPWVRGVSPLPRGGHQAWWIGAYSHDLGLP